MAGKISLVEPQHADAGVPWPYNSYTYRTSVGAYEVVFGIAPAHGEELASRP